jgi:phosphoesterase RecJ-like protein
MSLLTQADMRACEATSEDTEGIIDSIRDIDTVEVAVLLRESTDGLVRVSMRAKSAVDVGEIAVSLGGGGHRLAAGCTLDMPIEAAADLMRARIEAALSGDNA